MTDIYIVNKAIRWDELSIKLYGNIQYYNRLIEKNPHLQHKLFLVAGDKVNIVIEETNDIKIKSLKALWD
jgi:hypothetical protein